MKKLNDYSGILVVVCLVLVALVAVKVGAFKKAATTTDPAFAKK